MEQIRKKRVTIKHYINRDLKPDENGDFPVYVQIVASRQNQKMRSKTGLRLKHELDLKKHEHLLTIETTELFSKVRLMQENKKIQVRELKTPINLRNTDCSYLIEFFKTKYGCVFELDDINDVLEAVKTARKKRKP